MGKRVPVKTTIHQAAQYWRQYIDESDLSVDWSEAESHCWRCGCKRHLQRCHIVPDALGGKDEPANIVLLCKRCHAEGPNVTDPAIMWDWIKAYRVPYYDTFWGIQGMKEYEFIYKKSVNEEVEYILSQTDLCKDQLEEILQKTFAAVKKEASIHFGQPYFNTATMAGMYRMAFQTLAKECGVKFS